MIHHDERGPVTLITLDRPERRNAVDLEALAALARAVETAAGRVIELTGSAGHFCAGADLTGVEDEGFAVELHRVLSALRRVPVPVIAAVEGAALGAGTQLAIASDLRVAEPDARFGVPAARLGLSQWRTACRTSPLRSQLAAISASSLARSAASRPGWARAKAWRAAGSSPSAT
jgi:enoyl-CoA hydratase